MPSFVSIPEICLFFLIGIIDRPSYQILAVTTNYWFLCVLIRTKQGLDLSDELARAKRLLDEKYFEAGRLREESVAKGDSNNGARA